MANLEKVIRINETDYGTLVGGGTITKDGVEYEYDDSALYVIENPSPPAYALTAGQANTAVKDVLGRNIVDTYLTEGDAVGTLVIDVTYNTAAPSGTYDSIETALQEDKTVIIRVNVKTAGSHDFYDGGYIYYQFSNYNEHSICYTFVSVLDNRDDIGKRIEVLYINNDDTTNWASFRIPSPSLSTPLMDGTASVGSSNNYARADHRHPTDTSRQATLVSGTNIKTINGTSILGSGNLAIVHPNTFTNSEIDLVFTGYTIAPGGGSND